MKHSSRTRKQETQRKLLAYSAAAGAAIVGGNAADGEIIYSGAMEQDFGTDAGTLMVNFEGSQDDAMFRGVKTRFTASSYFTWFSARRSGNDFDMLETATHLVKKLSSSATVGTAANLPGTYYGLFYMRSTPGTMTTGNWATNGQSGFFGFSFTLEGESDSGLAAGSTVYGWAEVERIDAANGKLLGWAYEDSGDPIRVGQTSSIPEPNTLALLAFGAAGVTALRRRRGQR